MHRKTSKHGKPLFLGTPKTEETFRELPEYALTMDELARLL
jgi:hypothetical protein